MADTDKPAAAPAAAPTTFDMSLDEFCAQASGRGEAVEMLGGFYSDCTRKALVKASGDAFQAALTEFANRRA